jgi:hypothetical protein
MTTIVFQKINKTNIFCLAFAALFWSLSGWCYPQFIGYGYSTCLTCHYNGHGGGPINDYGRALWATEISSKFLYSKNISDEKAGELSGFLGSVKTPDYLKPHIKYRGLWNKTKYGSFQSEERVYHMQLDGGFSSQFGPEGKYLLTGTWGTWPLGTMVRDQNVNRFLAREYYGRLNVFDSWWFYGGLMERVYGIRNIDHTSFSRAPTKMAQRSQNSAAIVFHSLSAMVHKIEENWEGTFQYFGGHPNEPEEDRQSGVSLKYEYSLSETTRAGASFLSAESRNLKNRLLGGEFRTKISEGSSFMAEMGLIEEKTQAATRPSLGSYALLDTYIMIVQGYHFKWGIERYNQEFSSQSPDTWQWSLGFMAFPIHRVETRLEMIQKRNLISTSSSEDDWTMRGQVHVSL